MAGGVLAEHVLNQLIGQLPWITGRSWMAKARTYGTYR